MCPDSSAHRGPNNDQQLPQPYWGENSPVAPLDDSIQPQGQQHGEEQQTGVNQELTATGIKQKCLTNVERMFIKDQHTTSTDPYGSLKDVKDWTYFWSTPYWTLSVFNIALSSKTIVWIHNWCVFCYKLWLLLVAAFFSFHQSHTSCTTFLSYWDVKGAAQRPWDILRYFDYP